MEALQALPRVQAGGKAAAAALVAAVVADLCGDASGSELTGFVVAGDGGGDVAGVAGAVRAVLRDAVALGVSDAKFAAGLAKVGVPGDAASLLAATLTARRDDIVRKHRAALARTHYAHALRDFDWSVRHVLASDKLATVGDTLVAVSLKTDDGAGGTATVAVELTPAELDALIAKLEVAAGGALPK